jgi:DNA-binding protein
VQEEPVTPSEEPDEPQPSQEPETAEEEPVKIRDVIFVGIKPIMTYVTATLTQLASSPTVTIKARGKRITQAVDVSQMIVKRMDSVGYKVTGVRISSDSLLSQDGKMRNVSTIEVDVTKVDS